MKRLKKYLKLVNRKFWISTGFLLVFVQVGFAQQDSVARKKLPIIPIEAGLLAISQVGLSVFWYDDFGKFSFRDDLHQWKGMDKAGHIMSAYQVTRANFHLCKLGGVEERKAKSWALISTGILYTGIEVLDGFSKNYGFSTSDFLANAVGFGLAVVPESLQQRFSLRISYQNTQLATLRPELLGTQNLERFFKDYNGQTYWLSLWQPKRGKWYNYIGVSFGYGAYGLLGGSQNPAFNEKGKSLPSINRVSQYYFALDYNLIGLIPPEAKIRKWVGLLDFIKVPLPAISWQNGSKPQFHPIFF